jgi:hypothetical protein
MTGPIEKFETVLASGKSATVLRIDAKGFSVLPLFLSKASPAEIEISRRLGEAKFGHQFATVVPAEKRLDRPITSEIGGLGEVTLFAKRARQTASSLTVAAAPLHLLRLASADLPLDALHVNGGYFLFSPGELTSAWDAYGDPIGLTVSAGIIETLPQLKRTCLIKDDSGHRLDRIGFADSGVQLPDGRNVAPHPFGKPEANNGAPRAFALFHGSIKGCTPADAGCFDVAYLGRHALAGKMGGDMPIPRAGCVVRFTDPDYGMAMASAGPITYRLPGEPIEVVQTGPQIVQKGRSTRGFGDVFRTESMIAHAALPDVCAVSPFAWAADWDETRAARLAAGVTEEGSLFFCAVEGTSSLYSDLDKARGATLHDLSQLMIEQGASDAIHLDGGGSAQVFGSAGGALMTPMDIHFGLIERQAQYDRPLPTVLRLSL